MYKPGSKLNFERDDLRALAGEIPYKGVTKMKANLKKPYRSVIQLEKGRLRLGYHATAELAALAYDEAARQHFGAFARFNFPMENETKA